MKNIRVALFALIMLASCGDDKKSSIEPSSSGGDTSISAGPAPEPTADPEVTKGLDLAAKSDCFTCHKLTETAIGPAYAAVADKYRTIDRQAAIDSIIHQIQNGGSGKWGSVPMQPHNAITKDEASSMAVYILSIKK